MTYRALDLLIEQTPPTVRGRNPYWRPKPAVPASLVREPSWSWRMGMRESAPLRGPDGQPTRAWAPACAESDSKAVLLARDTVLTLDANAAYLAAASSVDLAHGRLNHTKRLPFDRRIPGYWEIRVYPWLVPGIWSPLGMAQHPDRIWVTTPTAALLASLVDMGYWRGVEVLDSWTCPTPCRVRNWSARVNSDRCSALQDRDRERYDAVKLGYSQAITLMGMDKKSLCYRPDWAQSIRAQHAANMWRRAFGALTRGCPVIAAGTTDELSVISGPYRSLMAQARLEGRPAPIVLDDSGQQLGTFKIKNATTAGDWMDDARAR